MEEDKSQILYHDLPQFSVCYRLLERICHRVFISCQQHQSFPLPCIKDFSPDGGPMIGLLSAMRQNPKVAWFVIACDMPLLNNKMLMNLKKQRQPNKFATCYFNNNSKKYEPLCCIYEPSIIDTLEANMQQQHFSLQKILFNNDVQKVLTDNPLQLSNANTKEQKQTFQQHITQSKT